MKTNTTSITELFEIRRTKEQAIQYLKNNPELLTDLIILSTENEKNTSWRAAWLLGHVMKKNELDVYPYIDLMIENFASYEEGHQRQILIILEKMNLNDAQEGLLFNHCMTLWENVNIIPSVRINAFKFLHKTSKKYPELKEELNLWKSDYYTQTLSPGIKNSLLKMK